MFLSEGPKNCILLDGHEWHILFEIGQDAIIGDPKSGEIKVVPLDALFRNRDVLEPIHATGAARIKVKRPIGSAGYIWWVGELCEMEEGETFLTVETSTAPRIAVFFPSEKRTRLYGYDETATYSLTSLKYVPNE
ncbi:MAG: hypothetical protein ABIH41_05655 [Nanoarchaeota archaeon]